MAAGLFVHMLLALGALAARSPAADASAAVCLPPGPADDLLRRCPSWIEMSRPLEVNAEGLDIALRRGPPGSYYSVLFYASWCSFSRNFYPIFEALCSTFPQITPLAIEQSSAMPSVFSRYGIHSFPSIMLASNKTRLFYHGPKDLDSLVHFYKEETGYDAITYIAVEEHVGVESSSVWARADSLKEVMAKEPYLAFAILFILLRGLFAFHREILCHLKALCSCGYVINMGVFGEFRQLLLERVLHLIDTKKLRSKLRLGNRLSNFRRGAKNARVWASSLASVSLGESSSSSSSSSSCSVK